MTKYLAIILGLLMSVSMAWADTYTGGFPPPGGVSYSFHDPAQMGAIGGTTIYFNNLNPAMYGSLFWSPNGIHVWDSEFQGPGASFWFWGYAPGNSETIWHSTDPLTFYSNTYGWVTAPVWLFVQAQAYDGTSNGWQAAGLPMVWSGTLPGVNPEGGPAMVYAITGDSFQVHLEFWAEQNGVINSLEPWFNGMDAGCGGSCLQEDFNGAFWWSSPEQPVPEPGSLLLLGTGLLGLGKLVRRRSI